MGVIYSVACTKCKVVRDLSKFYNDGSHVENRGDAIEYAKDIEKSSFKPALLVSFMAKHIGHECVFFNENSDCSDILDPCFGDENGYREDFDFWQES